MSDTNVRMTEYSHGSGYGCKIAPNLLESVLNSGFAISSYPRLLVGDDVAAYGYLGSIFGVRSKSSLI